MPATNLLVAEETKRPPCCNRTSAIASAGERPTSNGRVPRLPSGLTMQQTSFLDSLSCSVRGAPGGLLPQHAQEQLAQWIRFRSADPRASRKRERLLESLLPLIRKCARSFWDKGSLDAGDLEQVGAMAALQAIESFRPMRGKTLVGYAKDLHVIPAMRRAIRAQKTDVRLSEDGQRYHWQIKKLEKEGLSIEEIAAQIVTRGSKTKGLPVEKVIAIRDAARLEHTSIDDVRGAADASPNAEEQLAAAQVAQVVRARVSRLDRAHRAIIKALFLGDEPQPVHELAKRIGLTRADVLRMRDEALQQMRDIEDELDLED